MEKRRYLLAVSYYVYSKRTERGRMVALKLREVCGTDRACGYLFIQLLGEMERRGLALRWKSGVYLVPRERVEEVLRQLRELALAL